jgi:hypothetical protein
MKRERLPNRRQALTVEFEFAGNHYTETIGFFSDGGGGEIFGHGAKPGSTMDAILGDACILTSLLLQHGIEPSRIASSLSRQGEGNAASIIGALVDGLAQLVDPDGLL